MTAVCAWFSWLFLLFISGSLLHHHDHIAAFKSMRIRNRHKNLKSSKISCSSTNSNFIPSIEWHDEEQSNDRQLQDRTKLMDISLLECDDYVALPTTEGDFHFIEMSSRLMMNDLHSGNNRFKPKFYGVILKDTTTDVSPTNTLNKNKSNQSSNSNNNNNDYKIAQYGTLLENTHRDEMDDGTQCCYNKCLQRFRVVSILQRHPYLVADVEYPVHDTDVLAATQLLPIRDMSHTHMTHRCDHEEVAASVLNSCLSSSSPPTATATVNTAISSASTVVMDMQNVTFRSLLELEISVWSKLLQVMDLTRQQYTHYQAVDTTAATATSAAAADELSERLYALAPRINDNMSSTTASSSALSSVVGGSISLTDNDPVQSQSSSSSSSSQLFTDEYVRGRLQVISDFSFAVADTVAVTHEERQLLLQSRSVTQRLSFLNTALSKSCDFLSLVATQGVVATVEVTRDGYYISRQAPNAFQ